MALHLYNTAVRKIEEFTSADNTVGIYTCGPTVYDYLHVGNWAAYIYWDTLVRTLKAEGYAVERVLNITDVGHLVSDADEGEDKLEKGAKREGKTAWEIAQFYTDDFMAGVEKLGLITPDHTVRATDCIDEQLALVRTLKEKGYTYQIGDGIYFDTSKFPQYADFAQLNLDEMKAGARVEFDPEKRSASDFALWKFTPQGVIRDMEWDTPIDLLGDEISRKGFPGWHLECSAIAMKLLGESLDIHTGGIDHIPVHHTNEIAQSEAATGKQFSRFWLHNNHMKVNGSKISKSLGNGYTLQDIEERGFSPLDFRMLVLQSHYQTESNFSFDALEAAKNRRKHWRDVACLRWQIANSDDEDEELAESLRVDVDDLFAALQNNLDTPRALTVVDRMITRIENNFTAGVFAKAMTNTALYVVDRELGLGLRDSTPKPKEEIKQLFIKRLSARNAKDWELSDQLRDELLTHGVEVKDTANGSILSYV